MFRGRRRAAEATSVLVVDDDALVLAATRRLLERAGFRAVACGSARQALACVATERFDVMLSDVHMPGVNGLRLLRAVREHDFDIPVVLLTGKPDVPTAAAAVEYGAFKYLIKPLENDTLLSVLVRAANAGRMARLQREHLEQLQSGAFQAADRAGTDAALDRALASLWMAFQPIVHARTEAIFGHEALMRSTASVLPNPGAILEAAKRTQRLHDVGAAARAIVAAAIPSAPPEWIFFVNLHPQDLLDGSLYAQDDPFVALSRRIVLEITERASLDGFPDVTRRIAKLRELGFRIALDDLGAGYAGLTSFAVLEPEFVKLDMSLVRGVAHSRTKQKIVGSMVRLCHEMGKQIVAEGVEMSAERDALVDLGCDFLQGYLFARPDAAFPSVVGAAPSEAAPGKL
jgi:EAL domain-containing protein (putative c-di-GMP-specific phosphodiesterase class I)